MHHNELGQARKYNFAVQRDSGHIMNKRAIKTVIDFMWKRAMSDDNGKFDTLIPLHWCDARRNICAFVWSRGYVRL